MAITTKVITMRQGKAADYQASKMVSGELAIINDTEELHYSPKNGKSIRVATENDLKNLEEIEVDSALSSTSENPVQNKVVTAKFNELSGQNADKATTLWAIMQKTAFAEALTEAELTAFKTAWGIEGGGENEEITITQSGTKLIISGVSSISSINQTGATLALA